MDDARNTRLLGEIASYVRHHSEDIISGWDDLIRPIIGDRFEDDDSHTRGIAVLEMFADLLEGNPFESYSNYVRRLLIDLISAGFGPSWIIDTRDLFVEYLADIIPRTSLTGEMDKENVTVEYRRALMEFVEGPVGYQAVRDLALVSESQIAEAAEKSDASMMERELLLKVSSILHSALSRRDIFADLLPMLTELIPAAQAAVVFHFDEAGKLRLDKVHNLDDFKAAKSEIDLDDSIYHDILMHGEERILDRSRISKSVDFIFRRASSVGEKVIRVPPLSVAVAPIHAEKTCIGGLAFFNYKREGSFTSSDLSLLTVVTKQLTLALERVLYSERAQRQHRRIRTVLEIAESLKSGQTPREVAEIILGVVRKAVDFTRGAVYHIDEDGNTIPTGTIDIEAPLDVGQIDVPDKPEQLFVVALQRKEIVHIEDISSPGPFAGIKYPSPVEGVNEGSLLVAPLSIEEDPVGLLLMYHHDAHAFDDEEIDFLKVICQQSAHFLGRSLEYDRYVKNKIVIDEERALSQRMQQSLSPKSFREGPWEVQVSLLQGRELAGDFTIVKPYRRGFVAALGDVSGRGQPAGMIMMRAFGIINETVQSRDDPGEVLTEVNDILYRQFEGTTKEFTPHCYVTCALLAAGTKGEVKLASAGMPPAYLYRHGTGDVFELAERGVPLGINADYSYTTEHLGLGPGDKLLLCSSGLVTGSELGGGFFGIKELRELFAKSAHYPARVILDLIEGALPGIDESFEDDDRAVMIVALGDPKRKRLSFKGDDDEREIACETALRTLKRRTRNRDILFPVRLALHEIVKNAVEHGNKGDMSLDVHLSYLVGDGFIHMAVRDSGTGFDPKLLTRGIGSAAILKDKGRGFMMVKKLMDRVWYDSATGEINLFTRFIEPEA